MKIIELLFETIFFTSELFSRHETGTAGDQIATRMTIRPRDIPGV